MSAALIDGTRSAPHSLRGQIEQIAALSERLRAEAHQRNSIVQRSRARMQSGPAKANKIREETTRRAYLSAIDAIGGRATTKQIADHLGVTVSAAKTRTAAMMAGGYLTFTMRRKFRVWEAVDGGR